MKAFLFFVLPFVLVLASCENQSAQAQKTVSPPDPSLELGQLATFHGCDPDRSYIIVGYRDELEAETSKSWADQAYIVFIYINDLHDVKQAVIHRNSVLKK